MRTLAEEFLCFVDEWVYFFVFFWLFFCSVCFALVSVFFCLLSACLLSYLFLAFDWQVLCASQVLIAVMAWFLYLRWTWTCLAFS